MTKEEFRQKLENMTSEGQALYLNDLIAKMSKSVAERKENDPDLKLRAMGVLPPDVESLLAEASEIIGDYLQEMIKDDVTKASN